MQRRMVQGAVGVQISCRLSGDSSAPAMLLLHALGDQAENWQAVESRFASRFQVVNLDLRGHGDSSWPRAYSFELMRNDVVAVMDALDLRDIVLVGHSMGGVVAYIIAQTQPTRIARLVIEDVPPPFPRTRALPERPQGALSFDWSVVPAIAAEVNDVTRRWWTHLPDITAPTLIIGGGPTSHVPQDLLADVAQLVPDCTLITIPGGHNIHQTAPDEFSNAVLTWLTATDAGATPPGPSHRESALSGDETAT